jgi:hypothetical protein
MLGKAADYAAPLVLIVFAALRMLGAHGTVFATVLLVTFAVALAAHVRQEAVRREDHRHGR